MNRNSIRFAGLVNDWTFSQAKVYSDTLHEMGFYAKVIKSADDFIVAYSHRGFNQIECHAAFDAMFTNLEGERSEYGAG